MEADYSNCLSGAANALLSSSVRLPVSGDVRVRSRLPSIYLTISCLNVINSCDHHFQADAGEIEEALTSASKAVESINSQIQRFAHMVYLRFRYVNVT